MVFQYINVCQVPREKLKTSDLGLGFQHLPWDLANVNAWKTMFSLNIFIVEKAHYSQTIQLHKVIGLERKLIAYIVLPLIMNKLCTIRQM